MINYFFKNSNPACCMAGCFILNLMGLPLLKENFSYQVGFCFSTDLYPVIQMLAG
jgi:hypothetical protein